MGGAIRISGSSVGPGGFVIANNALFAKGSASCFVFSDSSAIVNAKVTFENNGVFGPVGYSSFTSSNATFTLRADTIELLDPNNNNFYPASGSLLIGAAGTTTYQVFDDYNCNSRENPPTVGAYQYSTSTNPGFAISKAFKQCANTSPATTASNNQQTTQASNNQQTTASSPSTSGSNKIFSSFVFVIFVVMFLIF